MIICSQCGLENREKAESCRHCGRGFSEKEHLEVDKVLEMLSPEARERYEIKELLGRGGMAAVYKAYDRRLKRYVALKILSEELVASRFEREAILAARLEHPNIIIIHDTGKERGKQYISMSYVEGDALEEIISRSKCPLPLERAVEIIKEVGAALSFAHGEGVIHRDIKPSNIMIDRRGRVIVTDFGIARTTMDFDMTKITAPGTVIGTPHYMSPEQIEGREVDKRTDIYAAGVILYEMLTGKLPFEADTAVALGVKKMMEKPRPPRELNSAIPEELERIVLKATEKELEERYQDMETLLKELEEYKEMGKERKKEEGGERRKAGEPRKEEERKEREILRLLEEDERKWEEAEKKKRTEERLLEGGRKAEEERKKEEIEGGGGGGIKFLIQERREKREREKRHRIRSRRRRRLWKGFLFIILLLALAYLLSKVIRREPGEEPVALPPGEVTDFLPPGE